MAAGAKLRAGRLKEDRSPSIHAPMWSRPHLVMRPFGRRPAGHGPASPLVVATRLMMRCTMTTLT